MVRMLRSTAALLAAAAAVAATLASPEVEIYGETPSRTPPALPYYLDGQPENWQVGVALRCVAGFYVHSHYIAELVCWGSSSTARVYRNLVGFRCCARPEGEGLHARLPLV